MSVEAPPADHAPPSAGASEAHAGFTLAVDGPIATITLSRPLKRNALLPEFWIDLPAAVTALSDAGATRALVLAADGEHFCAGMDVSVFSPENMAPTATPAQRADFEQLAARLQHTFTALEEARFPVIAAVQGACVGAGLDMISACDIRFAAADAYFRIEEINIGMMADVGTLQRLPKIMPDGIVRELAFTGDTLDVQRAEATGLINAVLPNADAARAKARAVAETIAGKAPLAVHGSKRAINHARDHAVADSLAFAAALQASIWSPDDMGEAFMARMEKRPGRFADLPPRRKRF